MLFVLCDLFRNSVLHSMAVLFKHFQVPKYHAKKAALVLRERTVSRQSVFRRYVSGSAFSGTGPELPAKYFRIP